ncbi:N-acetyltransferase DgcN [Nitratireductor luteus]|uniref:N-acetyltransferase DgcN n=1 Tax=Nitratireductor luteus TaxID=2976980 RepID=UPI00223EAE33|nr:N-acetyltransferase DgcN [Nitratireductor luteus]
MLKTPYLLFLGDAPDPLAAKVAQGIKDWRPEHCLGQLRLEGCKADLGLADLSVAEARAEGAQTLVVGAANRGGVISQKWLATLVEAAEAGMDIASGLHNRLTSLPDLVAAAKRNGTELFDVRVPQHDYPIADGKRRAGKRCLAVGTDCSVGKMYTALAMEKAMHEAGMKASFRATGQTGILITGSGVPLDAVVADFMAGSIEWLSPENEPDHWDLIEGQGSLFHPSFSGVTLALIHGGQPDALVLCHEPTRTHMRGLPHYGLPSLEELRDLALTTARIVNPDVKVTGVSVNTAAFSEDEAQSCLQAIETRMGLPTVDPFRQGARRLVEALDA